jgi:triphosphoribosyl-dephospho-CoA synthase
MPKPSRKSTLSNIANQNSATLGETPLWSLGQKATLSIILEASAKKAGNVHPDASFSDMRYEDFIRSAIAIGPFFDRCEPLTLGQLVYQAVAATRQTVAVNTNLGTLLLMAPIAIATSQLTKDKPETLKRSSTKSPTLKQLQRQTVKVLNDLTVDDSRWVYAAIRTASPGGLGKTDKLDVHSTDAPSCLLEAMTLAKEIDWVARIYASHFNDFFEQVLPLFAKQIELCPNSHEAARRFQIQWLAQHGDSLVLRKLGPVENNKLQAKASIVAETLSDANNIDVIEFERRWRKLDQWMRTSGHRRNPGTTADLIAACFFALLCTDQLMYSSSLSPVGRAN